MAAGTLATYWKKYKAISPWTAMAAYMVTLVVWGILFLPPTAERVTIAALVIPLGLTLDYLLHRAQTGKPNWESALITSSIVTVLMPASVALYVPPLAVALAIASKHFLLHGKRHVFNPAAFGVAVTAVAFGYSLGWWSDSYLWLTLLFGLINVWRVKKFPQVLTFLVAYLVLVLAVDGSLSLSTFSASTLGTQTVPLLLPFFFAFFMLPEPVTSLRPRSQQVEFGLVAALAGFLVSFVPVLSGGAILWGLLVANVYARARVV
ncbi:MAG: hypothetical protein M3N59_02280 [bacterium]|nr:hypothetical protein [bacterium]